ncbi:sodium channel protein Nach, partial [Asbolus verrucosus]
MSHNGRVFRVFWATVVTISLVAAVTLLCIAWIDFQEDPTLLVTDSTHYPIWNYPFPAVTICSFNKLSKKMTYKLAREMQKTYDISADELASEMRLLFQVIFNNNEEIPLRNYTRLQDILEQNEYTVEEIMQKLAPGCDTLLQRCKWKGEEKRCESIFEQIKTTEGFCCSFNYYALKNHNFSGALPNKIPKYPRRVSACGYLTALEVLLDSDPDDYFGTQIAAVGHRILLHNSYHFPDWSIQNVLTEKGIINLIGITPSITYSTPNIKYIDVNKRNCLFANESELHNFVQYSFHNCMVECRMNISKRLCGCIPFYYHSSRGTYPKARICSLRDIPCLTEHRKLIISSVPGYDFTAIKSDHRWGSEKHECGCLPDCDYVDYVAESSSGIFTRKYSTYYGGLLGLFIGFSFVSAVELIYFFTVRLAIDIKHKNEVARKKKDNNFVNVKPYHNHNEILNPKNLIVPNLRRRSNSNS